MAAMGFVEFVPGESVQTLYSQFYITHMPIYTVLVYRSMEADH